MRRGRSDLATVCSIAIIAYAAGDLVHEAVGHGLACLFSSEVTALSISTVALQTSGSSRMVAAAGSIANVVAGLVAFAAARREGPLGPLQYFLWLFATINLMNGVGYLFFSALLDSGDWSVVIARLEPHWAWRVGLGLAGAVLYAGVVRVAADRLAAMLNGGRVDPGEASHLVVPSYLTGGLLLLLASVLNPISPSLILLSGASSGFGAMLGLLVVQQMAEGRTATPRSPGEALRRDRRWIAAGIVIGISFVALIGRGIDLRR